MVYPNYSSGVYLVILLSQSVIVPLEHCPGQLQWVLSLNLFVYAHSTNAFLHARAYSE